VLRVAATLWRYSSRGYGGARGDNVMALQLTWQQRCGAVTSVVVALQLVLLRRFAWLRCYSSFFFFEGLLASSRIFNLFLYV